MFDVKQFIKNNEARGGPKLDAYFDTEDILTVGYGHRITKDSPADIRNLKEKDKISAERAESLFEADFKYHANEISKMPGFDKAPPLARAAAIDLAFNMGPNFYKDRKDKKGFTEFAKAFAEGNYEEAALELKRGSRKGTTSLYYKQTGDRPERVMALLAGQEREIKLTDKIESFVRSLRKAKGTVEDLASSLRVDIETASKLFQMPELKADKPEITLTDLMAKSQPSINFPNPNIDRPEITLEDLMAQSRPSVSVPSIPSAGSSQGYNPYTQNLDLGTRPVSAPEIPDPSSEALVSLQKKINPIDTYDMTREKVEVAKEPRIEDVKRSNDVFSSLDLLRAVTGQEDLKSNKEKENLSYEERLVSVHQYRRKRREEKIRGTGRSIAQGVTFGFADELEAMFIAGLKPEGDYSKELERIRKQQKRFEQLEPGKAIGFEIAGAIPGSIFAVPELLAKAGVKSIAKQAGIEGAVYGFGSGESFTERLGGATVGGLGGFAVGKVLSLATTPSSSGGLRTQSDELADRALDPDDASIGQKIEEAKADEVFTEVDNPKYTRKPLSEAKTFGEFWESATGALANFYNDKVTGVSDELMRVVSPQVGARFQRADETALRNVNKTLGNLAERLVPVVKIANEDKKVKGVLLDYGAGKLGKTREASLARLEKELAYELSTEHMNTLKAYLQVSFQKNRTLNKKVFGGEFSDEITYLHTRNNGFINRLKEKGLSDAEIEKMFGDKAYEPRSRGSYVDKKGIIPNPSEYDNPIVTDMQRLFKMERLAQLQEKFGVDISVIARRPEQKALNPQEFMDALFYSLTKKGISNDGAQYAVNKITDSIMGQQKAPHPLIQALNSGAYATTLAGPLSAILNLADIPLLGAKYGGRAVLEGLKALKPFKSVPDVDLKKMGLNDQVMGEFVNKTNDMASNSQGMMARSAELMRNGTDFLMKGSGFAALDIVGKKGVMRGVLRSAVDDAEANNLSKNWSFYFNDAELGVLEKEFKKHGTDWTKYKGKASELAEELMFAGLGQQQLISSAGRPAAWARNPNLRPLWALRGFVVKQQALALREVVGNIKAGKPEEAVKFLGRYATYGAGGYAITNELRQGIFGDGEMSVSGLVRGYGDAWASLLTANTLGLNDYQYGQIKENGILYALAEGSLPVILTRPVDIGKTAIDVIEGDRPSQALAMELPIIKQPTQLLERAAGAAGATEAEGMFSELQRKRNTNN